MNEEQKLARIERAERHAAQDRLLAGMYIHSDGSLRGCSVGCDAIDIQIARGVAPEDLTGIGCHEMVARHDGTPEWLERLRDAIFEGLPASDRHWWHVELARALPITDDWQPYHHRICERILLATLENKDRWQEPYGPQVIAAIEQTIAYHRNPTEAARSAAASAAWSAAESAAASAAESAARSVARRAAESAAASAARSVARRAARSAEWSAAASVESAAWSAAESAAWIAAGSAAYKRMATDILAVFTEGPTGK